MVSTIAPAMPMVKSAQRSRAAPEVPTVAESGVAGYEAISWQGVLAPGATPRPVVQRLNSDLRKVLALSEPQRQLAEQGYEPLSSTPEAFAALMQSEIAKWTRVTASGLRVK
jgi:tripartite-type tricarboxylate transporter receptor subunit TctC